jgi:hypothetical protein
VGLVNFNVPLENEYARLAIQERALRKTLENGTAVCLNCSRPKSMHGIHDGRCDCSATSFRFRSAEESKLASTSAALQVIEDLRLIE